MILVTGAAGFIGSNFVKYLNDQGITDIYVCDYLTNGMQFINLSECIYTSFITPDRIDIDLLKSVEQVFHFGAISSTTEWNGEILLERNYNYTIDLISKCISLNIPISYSSSASVYGNGTGPLNLYAYSKWLVDKWVESKLKCDSSLRIQGFRYFNVYGSNEWHKGSQASPYYQFMQQALETGQIKVFEGSDHYLRDFVSVDRVCKIQYAMSKTVESGIFDLGTGKQLSFKDVASQVAGETGSKIVEIAFPEHLKKHYQYNTRADMSRVDSIINKYSLGIF